MDGGTAACVQSQRHIKREHAREERLAALRAAAASEAKDEQQQQQQQQQQQGNDKEAAAAADSAGKPKTAEQESKATTEESKATIVDLQPETKAAVDGMMAKGDTQPGEGPAALALAAEEAKVAASLAARAWRADLPDDERVAIGQSCKRLLDVRDASRTVPPPPAPLRPSAPPPLSAVCTLQIMGRGAPAIHLRCGRLR